MLQEDSSYGGDYTCYISFITRDDEKYEIRINEIQHAEEKPEDSIFIFQKYKNGSLEGDYHSEYFGTRYYFRGNAADTFWDIYENI